MPELEQCASDALPVAVNLGDDATAGMAALVLGHRRILQGRFLDAARWVAEAQLHQERHDPMATTDHSASATPHERLATIGVTLRRRAQTIHCPEAATPMSGGAQIVVAQRGEQQFLTGIAEDSCWAKGAVSRPVQSRPSGLLLSDLWVLAHRTVIGY